MVMNNSAPKFYVLLDTLDWRVLPNRYSSADEARTAVAQWRQSYPDQAGRYTACALVSVQRMSDDPRSRDELATLIGEHLPVIDHQPYGDVTESGEVFIEGCINLQEVADAVRAWFGGLQ